MEKKYQMPDEQTLNERMFDIGFDYFAAKTGLVHKIAEKEVLPSGVAVLINLGFMQYRDYLKNGGMDERMVEKSMYFKLRSKSKLYEAIFQDHPQALKELERTKDYIPLEK